MPTGMELAESSVPFASYEDGIVVWNLVEIPAFGTAVIEFSALVPRFGNVHKLRRGRSEIWRRVCCASPPPPLCVIDVGTVSCDS
jgi:hypothetical protein